MASVRNKWSLDQLRSNIKKKEDTGNGSGGMNNYYRFWDMKIGESAVIRFLPDRNNENPLGFIVEKLNHNLTINGENKSVPCLTMYGEECPICKLSTSYYKRDDKVNGKKYWRKKQYLAQVLVIEDPLPAGEDGENNEGKIRNIAMGPKLYECIKDAFESGDLDNIPFDFEVGTNFTIKKTQQGEYADYSRSKFVKHESALDDDTVEHVEETIIDLAELLPRHPGRDKVEAMLEAALNGGSYRDRVNDGEDDDDGDIADVASSARQAADSASRRQADRQAEKQQSTRTSTDGDDDDVDSMLATIRARRQQSRGE